MTLLEAKTGVDTSSAIAAITDGMTILVTVFIAPPPKSPKEISPETLDQILIGSTQDTNLPNRV
ncbi:hypothetical protein [Bradyrhizobium sp. STM 3843]|uniref:hypothetical protein n=1 Tax=Bradyrhizobium sp. STM 3843 TaxID=551947 RepID=UPI00031AB386|nr:hypothetical protein [Bradyrhizobium sp. STM 3843]